jgi:hypothetical protein
MRLTLQVSEKAHALMRVLKAVTALQAARRRFNVQVAHLVLRRIVLPPTPASNAHEDQRAALAQALRLFAVPGIIKMSADNRLARHVGQTVCA